MAMQDDEPLQVSVVFQALTRPTTVMGVDYDYFIGESLVVMLAFIYSGDFLLGLLFLPLHTAGWVLTQRDPHSFKLLSVRASLGSVRLKRVWGCQSYGEF
jgi:type IV secretory pathway VirB3-like protein